MSIGSILGNRYQVVKAIGKGSFSRVFQCLDLVRKDMTSVKIVKRGEDCFDAGLSEVRVLMLLNQDDGVANEAIVHLRDYFYFKEHLIIVTECLCETLFQHLNIAHGSCGGGIDPAVVAAQAKKLLQALKFIHSQDVIHGDIKPDNICLTCTDPRCVKLIDFNSCVSKLDALTSYMGSRWYRPPEVILGIPPDFKIDLWALGCTLLEEVLGFPIFKGTSVAAVLAAQHAVLGPHPTALLAKSPPSVRAMYFTPDDRLYVLDPPGRERGALKLIPVPTPLQELLSSHDSLMVDFITSLLQYEPENRPDASAALEHPFLANMPDTPLRELPLALMDELQIGATPSSAPNNFRSKSSSSTSSSTSSSFKSKCDSRPGSFFKQRGQGTASSALAGDSDSKSLWSSASRQTSQ